MLNTAVADVLNDFANELEQASDFKTALNALIKTTIIEHKRIIFNGNGYDDEWIKEAEIRGLLNLKSTPEAMATFLDQKNKDLFTKFGIMSIAEMQSRFEILVDNYSKIINIEALTMIDMTRKDILPAITASIKELSDTASSVKSVSPDLELSYEVSTIIKLAKLQDCIASKVDVLESEVLEVKEICNVFDQSCAYRDRIFIAMQNLRACVDQAETICATKYWPFPTYGELLFGVK